MLIFYYVFFFFFEIFFIFFAINQSFNEVLKSNMDETRSCFQLLKRAFEPFDCKHDSSKDKERPFSVDKFPHCNLNIDKRKLIRCSILILLFQDETGQLNVILTIRSYKLRSYPGQLCFPGGKYDSNLDDTYEETAYREANEEIGLDKQNLLIIGKLCPIISPVGHYMVPIVGLLCNRKHPEVDTHDTCAIVKSLRANPDEVESIVRVPLSYFVNNAANPDVLMLNEERIRVHGFLGDYVRRFNMAESSDGMLPVKRLMVCIGDEYFDGVVPSLNALYGINATLLLFIAYLFESATCTSASYADKLNTLNTLLEPFSITEYPKLIRMFSFNLYKNYLETKKERSSTGLISRARL